MHPWPPASTVTNVCFYNREEDGTVVRKHLDFQSGRKQSNSFSVVSQLKVDCISIYICTHVHSCANHQQQCTMRARWCIPSTSVEGGCDEYIPGTGGTRLPFYCYHCCASCFAVTLRTRLVRDSWRWYQCMEQDPIGLLRPRCILLLWLCM